MAHFSYTIKDNRFGPRQGLEGPFHYPNGRVLYYDPKEGRYYDPTTDFYLDNDEVDLLNQMVFDKLAGVK